MPAKSKAQRRLFGIAKAVKSGKLSPDEVSGAALNIAKNLSSKEIDKFAKTKEKNLPQYKEKKLREYIQKYISEILEELESEKQSINEASYTKKNYIAISDIIKNAESKYEIASSLAGLFAKDNPSFDRDKFLSACGVL